MYFSFLYQILSLWPIISVEQQIAIQIDVYHYHLKCCRIQGLLETSLLLMYVGVLAFLLLSSRLGRLGKRGAGTVIP